MAFLNEQGLSHLWSHILAKIGGKVDRVDGKGLSTNDYTDEEKDKLNTAYDHAQAKGSAFNSGLYKITTNAQGHVTATIAVAKSDITALGIPSEMPELNYATDEDVEAMLEELFPTPSIPTGAIVLTCTDGYTNLYTNEDIYIISGLNRLWEDDTDQTCYLLWKPDSSYSQAEYFEAQFEYIDYEVFPGVYDGYYTIRFTNPLTNAETVYCIYDYYADYATLSTENNYNLGGGGTI